MEIDVWEKGKPFGEILKAQGILYKDPLNILAAPFLSTRIEGADTTIFIAGIDHPFRSRLFGYLFNEVAPVKAIGSEVFSAVGDYVIPQAIKHNLVTSDPYYRDFPRLHRIHSQDPHIGPVYNQFVDQHMDKWIQCLMRDPNDDVFETIAELFFYQGTQDMVLRLQQELNQTFRPYNFLRSVLEYQSITFKHFLAEQPEFQDAPNLNNEATYRRIDTMPAESRDDLLFKYIFSLDQETKAVTLKHYAMMDKKILVNLLGREVFACFGDITHGVKVVDADCVSIKDSEGNSVMLTPVLKDGKYSWQITDKTLTPKYKKESLYPVLAWMKTLQGRRFLTQIEWEQVAQYSGWFHKDQDDVFLGKALVSYLSPDITSQWPDTMRLAQSHIDMQIGVAQTAVWMSLDEHEKQLLSDKNPLIPVLEHTISQSQ